MTNDQKKKADAWFAFVLLVVLLFGAILFSIDARGHEWYPSECCSGMDCAPVESAQFTQPIEVGTLPQLVVTTRIGTTIIPKNAVWRESKDGKMHACIRPYDKNPLTNFICVFAPPSM